MNLLENTVNLTVRSLTTVTHTLTVLLKTPFLRPSGSFKTTTELTNLFLPMRSHRNQSIGSIEHQGQSICIPEVAASTKTRQGLYMRTILRKVTGKLGQGKEVIWNWHAHQVNILQQGIVSSQMTTTQYFPSLP